MNKNKIVFGFISTCIWVVGCSGIRVVQRTPVGGEVALVGMPEGAREKADVYMREHCPMGYDIVEEHEAVVGQDTTTQANSVTGRGRTIFGAPIAQTNTIQSSSTTDRREWRILYQCRQPIPHNNNPQPNGYPPVPPAPTLVPAPMPTQPMPAPTVLPSSPLTAPSTIRPSAQLTQPQTHVLIVSWAPSQIQ